MKKQIILLVFCLFASSSGVFSQDNQSGNQYKAAITLGFLQGGGSLAGADFEFLVSERVGMQLGAGFVGFGAGINYHLNPGIKSSMISLQYWHQGFRDSYAQSLLGPTYIWRARKLLLTAQLGMGFALEEGPSWPANKKQPPVMLMYSFGVYLPFK